MDSVVLGHIMFGNLSNKVMVQTDLKKIQLANTAVILDVCI
jgi:hypothetical protein